MEQDCIAERTEKERPRAPIRRDAMEEVVALDEPQRSAAPAERK